MADEDLTMLATEKVVEVPEEEEQEGIEMAMEHLDITPRYPSDVRAGCGKEPQATEDGELPGCRDSRNTSIDLFDSSSSDSYIENAQVENVESQSNNRCAEEGETTEDTLDCQFNKRNCYRPRSKCSLWKVVSKHSGPKREHYHLVYISSAKNWGHNSKLGKAIQAKEYKCTSVACIKCLIKYITTVDDHTIFRNILQQSDAELFQCVAHRLGVNPDSNEYNKIVGAERGDNILSEQGPARRTILGLVDPGDTGTNQELLQDPFNRGIDINNGRDGPGNEQGALQRGRGRGFSGAATTAFAQENQKFVMLLCENQALTREKLRSFYSQHLAGLPSSLLKGLTSDLRSQYKYQNHLVFQETAEQRLERAKALALRRDPNANSTSTIYDGVAELLKNLHANHINEFHFARQTRRHFLGLTGKQNNLLFWGPPSTGQTLIMKSLVEMHYNYAIITGLQPTPPFNFSSAYNRNSVLWTNANLLTTSSNSGNYWRAGKP